MRYDLDTPGTPPEQYFTQTATDGWVVGRAEHGPAGVDQQHARASAATRSRSTERRLASPSAAAQPSLFALIDVATKKTIATRLFAGDPDPNQPFAAFTAFSPDGTAMMQALQSQLWLRSADATLADLSPQPLFTSRSRHRCRVDTFLVAEG